MHEGDSVLPSFRGFAGRLPLILFATAFALQSGCVGTPISTGNSPVPPSNSQRDFPLNNLRTANISIRPQNKSPQSTATDPSIRTWLALSSEQHQEGLMFVPVEEIADDQGMLFVFNDERIRGFWMKNTITALDIAFARMDGTIVAIHTMPPLTLQSFSSFEPAMFALEVKAGILGKLGVQEGDKLIIPEEVFKDVP